MLPAMQSAVTALKEVRDAKVENRSGITQEDASKIASAESAIHGGQIPANSVAGKAQVGSCQHVEHWSHLQSYMPTCSSCSNTF